MDDVSISYMGWHPSHGRTHMFQDGSNHQPYIYIYIHMEVSSCERHPSMDVLVAGKSHQRGGFWKQRCLPKGSFHLQ